MITVEQVENHFVSRLRDTHGSPAPSIILSLARRLGVVTMEQLEAAAERIVRTRKARTFPSVAECLEIIDAIAKAPPPAQGQAKPRRDDDWPEDVALRFLGRHPLAIQAARSGWIGPLVNFVRRQHRMPEAGEVPGLMRIQREFEDTLAKTMRDDAGEMVRRWRPLGEAMAAQQGQWAEQVLAGQPRREAA